jgi:hypothetical protein
MQDSCQRYMGQKSGKAWGLEAAFSVTVVNFTNFVAV